MKLKVKRLWFRGDLEKVIVSLFKIPQLKEKFDEGPVYDGEMRPRGIKIGSGYWPADAIMQRLPKEERDAYLILTSLELKGEYGRIHGRVISRLLLLQIMLFGQVKIVIFLIQLNLILMH